MLKEKDVRLIELKETTNWQAYLTKAWEQPYGQELSQFLDLEYSNEIIYPPRSAIFTALDWTPFEKVKVVILGQDPYHGENQAHGLSFSVQPGNKVPPSLRNIYKELENDLGVTPVNHGYLKKWATEGVLLLNTVLTVRAGQANSHRGHGWEQLTDSLLEGLNQRKEPIVFILWGKPAQSKSSLIDQKKHFILNAPHPSPLSSYRGFFGSRPFSQANKLLIESGQRPVDWRLPESV